MLACSAQADCCAHVWVMLHALGMRRNGVLSGRQASVPYAKPVCPVARAPASTDIKLLFCICRPSSSTLSLVATSPGHSAWWCACCYWRRPWLCG